MESLGLKAELDGQDTLELIDDGIGQHELYTTVNRRPDDPARWTASDER